MPTLFFAGLRLPFELAPELGFEMLQAQVMTLTGLVPARQLLFAVNAEKKAGEIATDADLMLLNGSEDDIACMDVNDFYLPPSGGEPRAAAARPLASSLALIASTCSRSFFGDSEAMQARMEVIGAGGKNYIICSTCSEVCKERAGMPLSFDAAERRLAVPFKCECAEAGGECLFQEACGTMTSSLVATSGEGSGLQEAFTMQGLLHVVQEMIMPYARDNSLSPQQFQQFQSHIASAAQTVQRYCTAHGLKQARTTIPIGLLIKRATESLEKAKADNATTGGSLQWDFQDELLIALLRWFKSPAFFKWTNNMPCQSCGSEGTESVGATRQLLPEERAGLAGIVEIHRCNQCGNMNRFPRYNDPVKLLSWKKGRCGEFANAFTFCCFALGFKSRYVVNFEDHVWTEVYSPHKQRWLHLDSCEVAIDKPLEYECGWGKKITWCVAAGVDEVVDVTKRYTKNWPAMLERRKAMVPEELSRLLIAAKNISQRVWCFSKIAAAGDSSSGGAGGASACITRSQMLPRFAMLARLQTEEERQMQASASFDDGVRAEEEKSGRISGSLLWRAQRGELGPTATDAANGAGTASASSSSETASASALLPEPSSTPENQWLANNGIVVGGWRQLINGSSGLDPAQIRSCSSFGAQSLAVTKDGKLWWRSVPAAPSDPAKVAAASKWKAVAVQTFSPGSEPGCDGATWPSEGQILCAVACEYKKLSFFAFLSAAEGGDGALEVWRVSFDRLPSPSLSAAADGTGATTVDAKPKEGWAAKRVSFPSLPAPPLPTVAASDDIDSHHVSSAVAADGHIFVIAGGKLYRSSIPLATVSSEASAEGASWQLVAEASGCRFLTTSFSDPSVLLALKTIPGATPEEESKSQVVVLTPSEVATSRGRVTVKMVGVDGSEAGLSVSVPASFLSSSAKSAAANESIALTASSPVFSFEPDDWFALVPVGQPSEARWNKDRGCSPAVWQVAASYFQNERQKTHSLPSSLDSVSTWSPPFYLDAVTGAQPVTSSLRSIAFPIELAGVDAAAVAVSSAPTSTDVEPFKAAIDGRRPKMTINLSGSPNKDIKDKIDAGVYELRYYRAPKVSVKGNTSVGQAYGRCVAVSSSPVLIIRRKEEKTGAGEASISSWVPLLPAENVAGLAIATGGTGGLFPRLVAFTKNGDSWDVRLPPALIKLGGLGAGGGEEKKQTAASEEEGNRDKDREAALLALPLPARIQLLFAQHTKGCGQPSCDHPGCASNPSVGPQDPKKAVLSAAASAKAGSGDGGTTDRFPGLVCPRLALPSAQTPTASEKAGNLRGTNAAAGAGGS